MSDQGSYIDRIVEDNKNGKKIIVAQGFGVSTDTKKVLELLMEQGIPFEFDTREREGVHEVFPDPVTIQTTKYNKYQRINTQKKASKINAEQKKRSRAKDRKKSKKQNRRKK